MALFNFPSSPTINQEYTFNGKTWLWNGTAWQIKTTTFNGIRTVDTFTGDGTTTNFALSSTPASENDVTVNYQGIMQLHDAYTIDGNYIVFDSAPENNVNIEVIVDVFGLATPVSNITDLGDVNTSTVTPVDGQALIWDSNGSNWAPGNVAAGGETFHPFLLAGM